MGPKASPLSLELTEFIHGGVSLYLATRDQDLRPRGTRIWAARVGEERTDVELFGHPEALSSHLPALEENGQMALSLARPSDDNAYQLKGTFLSHRACRGKDRSYIQGQVTKLFDDLARIGIPPSTFASWKPWPATSIVLRVTEVYCQTPGPRAGEEVTP